MSSTYYIALTVMTLLDMNLEKLREELGGKFKLATVFYVANETLSAIWDLHIRGYVHRDIKPTNFCLGVGTMASKVFLIDFGETVKKGKKIKYSTPDAYSLPYWSIESHKRGPAKERADIESWFYMILDMCVHSLLKEY
uniref:non-specific serine/threonine protein kinase n=1 Tax=Heterorhabditis bacteriophora TaxID=37862 RepID=A0A1I7X0T1_HETBA